MHAEIWTTAAGARFLVLFGCGPDRRVRPADLPPHLRDATILCREPVAADAAAVLSPLAAGVVPLEVGLKIFNPGGEP
jgi:hypothetical protein